MFTTEELKQAMELYDRLSSSQKERLEFVERGLLQNTFLVRDINAASRSDFDLLTRNRIMVQSFFSIFGYSLSIDRDAGVARLFCEKDVQTTRTPLSGRLALLLCVIWTIYRDRMADGAMLRILRTTTADILTELEKYGIRNQFTGKAYSDAAKELKRYNLIGFEGDVLDGSTIIMLYPSLQFCMDETAFSSFVNGVIEERLQKNIEESEMELEEAEEEEEDDG